MYRDDVKDLMSQKRESLFDVLSSFITIYIRMRVAFPHLEKERMELLELMKKYISIDNNEKEVLKLIKKHYGNIDDHEGVDELLEEFDSMAIEMYDYMQKTFMDYEDVIYDYGSLVDLLIHRIECFSKGKNYEPGIEWRRRMIHRKMNFQIFDDDYKVKMMELVPHLEVPKEEFDG